jgi:hypothetical protein
MEKLYFEYYRLGDVNKNIKTAEPVLRDADLVTVDLKSVKSSEVSIKQKYSPNGFDGKEICAISRYAGISNRVSSFGYTNITHLLTMNPALCLFLRCCGISLKALIAVFKTIILKVRRILISTLF